mmetsp:Transcript_2166/g.5001  ORF Transcript_2166/g.5001 Transcript_2166/m.5001 type:complete len:605 (-) Transcript_2166:334-2148(-)|eukprot:CAMPEP_0177722670 /NCGR_PEP_ID=MMETSP0484_2-20121128/17806_1 /TAXON_ID=354590 /ORGANISM="Rhodomonas lens, Strain RHODO" /LENGTH=604 /DNA_ID=CAMNT_0019235061 /DNA_START=105 /DNA_END=1919 /DNA_ORIENTATION=-
MGDNLRVGRYFTCVPNAQQAIESLTGSEMYFCVLPLAHPRARREYDGKTERNEPFTRSDLTLPSNVWASNVVGALSPWINLDSKKHKVRTDSEKAVKQEIAWAQHISCPAVIAPTPQRSCLNYARCIYEQFSGYGNTAIYVHMPMVWPDDPEQLDDPWETWNTIRMLCEHHPSLSVALEVTGDLPSQETISQWGCEPVRLLIIPTSIFLTNQSGFPVLSKKHQAVLRTFFDHHVEVCISGRPRHDGDMLVYTQYLSHLHATRPGLSESERFEQPYWDFLQVPLQPLADNLESQTYEVFEKDPVKYVNYEEAVLLALKDMQAAHPQTAPYIVMVVGAGRGPLVRASLRASERCGIPIFCYALDKNPNAVVTLRNMRITEGWLDKVEVVHSDMRDFQPKEKADILVSELLGSFGDNELSPECLDGAQRFLHAERGVSIPVAYTSWIAPISSSKLHQEVKAYNDVKHFETTYVVKMHRHKVLSAAQETWTFEHPNHQVPIDNTRQSTHRFQVARSSCLHGFAGYFDALLYGDVHISIYPETFSTGMFSWFPLFFPIRNPMYVPEGSEIVLHLSRCVADKKVWYEWAVSEPSVGPVNNVNGRSFSIGM